jgi:hypothetical protein
MKKGLAILCVIAIIFNVYIYVYTDENGEEWTGKQDKDIDNIDFSEFSVSVPEMMVGDVAQYEYSIFIEIYNENKSSGEWEKTTLTANGNLIERIPEIVKKLDGFNIEHSVFTKREETEASFTVVFDSSDGDPLVANGEIRGTREEYLDLNEQVVIQTETNGHVEIEKIKNFPLPISYDGAMRSYPNPNIEEEETLDDKIFLGNKVRKLGDSGNVTEIPDNADFSEWLTQTYSWNVERGEKIGGFNTLMINISTGFFQGWLPFNKKVWIANEVPFPVKVFIRTNTSFEGKNESFYMIIEHTRELKQFEDFSRGTKEVPWGECEAAVHFHARHPIGEFTSWDYMPTAGTEFDKSSFDFNPDSALELAIEDSDLLDRYTNKYDDVTIMWATYNAERDPRDEFLGKAGSYNWNISFGYKPSQYEAEEAYDNYRNNDEYPNWGMYVNLTHVVTKEPGRDRYSETTELTNEAEYEWGDAELARFELSNSGLTLASSEEILKLDPEVKEKAFNPVTDEINFQDTTYSIVMGGITDANMPGADIIESITGITLPTSKYSWAIQKGTVYQAGSTFSAAVDVENGQLLYVMEISGTELYSVFG